MTNIVVLVSGGGTNLQALLNADFAGKLGGGRIVAVISSNPNAKAVLRAMAIGVATCVLDRSDFEDRDEFSRALLLKLWEFEADLVILAGFMCILNEEICRAFEHRMINVHPSLIPAFCGEGYYGLRVHRAVLEYGVKLTGATVHFVTSKTDAGPIILQKAIPVQDIDTPESLQKRVMELCEWDLLCRAVQLFCEGRLEVIGRRVKLK